MVFSEIKKGMVSNYLICLTWGFLIVTCIIPVLINLKEVTVKKKLQYMEKLYATRNLLNKISSLSQSFFS